MIPWSKRTSTAPFIGWQELLTDSENSTLLLVRKKKRIVNPKKVIMKTLKVVCTIIGFFILALVFTQCQKEELIVEDEGPLVTITNQPAPIVAGNCLSVPVIWSDGFALDLRGEPGTLPKLNGEWWYVWGQDPVKPSDPICSCKPHSVKPRLCADGSEPGDGWSTVYKAYLENSEFNEWQAESTFPGRGSAFYVDLVDWADNLESSEWSLRSQVRTEIVLYENLELPMLEYAMRHVSGWVTNEVHGLQTTLENVPLLGPGDRSTVYSHNMRFTVQKLLVDEDNIVDGSLTWVPNSGWTETELDPGPLINKPIINQVVYEAPDSPAYFQPEVDVEGKLVYRYNWNVRAFNEGAGFYRITYSFDEYGGPVDLNTYFDENTEIIAPVIGHLPTPVGGGAAKLDIENNLTYMDIYIRP